MEEKSLLKNSIYNVLYKVLNTFYPLVSVTYISHALLSEGVGRVAYAQNIASYFVLMAALGLPTYGTKKIAEARNNNKEVCCVFSELFIVNTISTSVCLLIYYGLIFRLSYFESNRLLYIVSGFTIAFNYINIDWFYQGKEEYGYIALRSLIIKMFSLLALFAFVRNQNDYVKYALIYAIAVGGNNFLNILRVGKYNLKITFKGLKISRHIKPVFILLCSVFAIEMYTLLDTTMVGYLCGDKYVGYYTNSIKLVKVVVSVIAAIGGVLLPRLSYYHREAKYAECNVVISKVFIIMLYFFVPCAIGMFLTADLIIPILYGPSFEPASTTLKIFSILILVLGFSNLFGTQVLITFNSEKKLLLSTIIGAVSNVIMNAILIPIWRHNGAALASVISETLVTLMTFYFARAFIKLIVARRFISSVLIGGVIMGMTICLIRVYLQNMATLLQFIVIVIVGIIVYVGATLLIDKRIIEMVGKIDGSNKRKI